MFTSSNRSVSFAFPPALSRFVCVVVVWLASGAKSAYKVQRVCGGLCNFACIRVKCNKNALCSPNKDMLYFCTIWGVR